MPTQTTQAPSHRGTLALRGPREQQALEQLAVTTFAPGVAVTLVLAFIALIVVIPIYETIQDIATRSRTRARMMHEGVPREQWPRRRPLIANLLEELPMPAPAALRALEDELLLTSPAGRELRPVTQSVLSTLGVGNRSVVVGRHGWLHYNRGVDYVTGPGFLEPEVIDQARVNGRTADPRPAILQLHRELQAIGVALVVVPIPDKAVILPGTLAADLEGTYGLQNRSWQAFAEELRRSGVHLLDLTRPMADAQQAGRVQFLRADTHWSPAGIDVTARALATLLTRDLGISVGSSGRYTRQPRQYERDVADLVDLLDLPPSHARRLASQHVDLDLVREADGRQWQSMPASEILVIGDSFTEAWSVSQNVATEGAGLAEQLSYYLQRPVERRASHSYRPFDVRESLGRSLDEVRRTAAGRRVVIWEFAGRKLLTEDWSLLP